MRAADCAPLVLVVDDEDADRAQIHTILRRYEAACVEVRRAFEAIAYLRRDAPFADAERPALVLLDWKLAGTGLAVLRTIRQAPELRTIPVVVLSRSGADADVTTAHANYANAFVKKHIDLGEFHCQLSSICEFFLRVAMLPSVGSSRHPCRDRGKID